MGIIKEICDVIRQKNKKHIIRFEHVIKNNHELDFLFNNFETYEKEVHGIKRKFLKGVNADPGVTEQTLYLLCKEFPDNRGNVKVLNIGCGRKEQMSYLEKLGFDGYGVDYDIESDSEKVKYHDLNDTCDLPFEDVKFDCVICQEVIEHIENPWLLLRKINKVIKKDAILILTTPNISSIAGRKIFSKSDQGFFLYFNENNLWQHINPMPYWLMIHVAGYNGFELKKLSGNDEFYFEYIAHGDEDYQKRVTIQNNYVLHYVFRSVDNAIKLYSPEPTYNHVW